jgi:dihydrodipicolinate synthase/N-acetylneuraminate lyase
MANRIRGVFPALITPFTADGEVDEPKLRAFLSFLLPEVHGLYPCGSYGSGPLMTEEQRRRVAEIIVEETKGAIPIVLHVGTADTQSTIRLAKHAEGLGVDAIACLTPYYYRHRFDNIVQHFRRVIDSVETPVFLYHNPKYTNLATFTAEQLARLADMGLRGLKDSSADISFFYNCVAAVDKPGFTFLIGSQTMLMPSLLGGGHGCVSGLSNLFPRLVNSIYEKVLAGSMQEALDLQRKANVLRKITGEGIPVPFYHSALRLRGIDIGVPKAPHLPLSREDEDRIRQPVLEAMRLEESLPSLATV